MNKRPLCLICLCFMAIMWLLQATGIAQKWWTPHFLVLQEYGEQEADCQVYGTVRSQAPKTKSIYIYLEDVSFIVHSEQYFQKQMIIKYTGNQAFGVGNVLMAKGKLELPQKPTNPGQFDAVAYYRARNINLFVNSDSFAIVDAKSNHLRKFLYRIRERFGANFNQLLPQYEGVLRAILLGDKSVLNEEVKIQYQMGGYIHVLAISGLHLSLLGMGLYRLLMKAGSGRFAAGGAAVAFLFCYCLLTGESVSAIRALFMFGLNIGARFVGRTYDMLSAISLSAILILLEYPNYLYDSSFLLSFGAVFALGAVLPVVTPRTGQYEKKDRKLRHRLLSQLKSGLLAGIVIWLTTLPVVLYFFYEVSLYGLLLNLLVIPTVGIVLVSGLLGGSLGFVSMALGKIALLPAGGLLALYEWMAKGAQHLPYPTWILGKPQMWQIIVYYTVFLGVLLFWRYGKAGEKSVRFRGALVLSFAILMPLFLSLRFDSGLTITALDVGQGDALVIRTESGHCYLVDGGSSSVSGVGTYRIVPYLKSQGIRTLDSVWVTHPDEDHVNGVVELFESIAGHQTSLRVKQCILPAWMKENEDSAIIRTTAKKAGIPIVYVEKGDFLKDGETTFQVLHPGGETYEEDLNAGSLSFVLKYGAFQGLFTGDLCAEGEAAVEQIVNPCVFLKVAHHGSKNSTSETFLEKVKPQISMISCGKKNRYGHPHPELLERLQEVDSKIYNTAESGAVRLKTDGHKISFVGRVLL